MISDMDFYNSFYTFTTKTTAYIRYILIMIHNYLDKNHEINRNPSQVNIEHIMPKNSDQWEIDAKTRDAYLWRLGNLALLDDKLNKKASNQPFEDKKKLYAKSLIHPNQELANYSRWTSQEIENRQKKLAEIALKIWC